MLLKIKSFLHDYFRIKRLKKFAESYPDLANLSVLDVGGTPYMWDRLNKHFGLVPKQVTLLNSNPVHLSSDNNSYQTVVGDARKLPFVDGQFDLVFSNSVIEHVGNSMDKSEFARECQRVGKEIYIQTPNRWFPIEPHIVALFIHWLPRNLYTKVHFISIMHLYQTSLRFKNGNSGSINTYKSADGADLLSYRQLKQLFPKNMIYKERTIGLDKSFVVSTRELGF
ncbi:MAG: class I SAM-dependent methyltransferase [Cyanobacteria bacterium P01_G01_bin.39]